MLSAFGAPAELSIYDAVWRREKVMFPKKKLVQFEKST
jgi:hypothetical protein